MTSLVLSSVTRGMETRFCCESYFLLFPEQTREVNFQKNVSMNFYDHSRLVEDRNSEVTKMFYFPDPPQGFFHFTSMCNLNKILLVLQNFPISIKLFYAMFWTLHCRFFWFISF